MGKTGAIDQEPAVYAHHVRALRARQDRDDDEAIGAHMTRGGFRDQHANERRDRKAGRTKPAYGRIVDFFTASPLTGRDRQSGGVRIPHFDVKPITPTHVPTSKDGQRRVQKNTPATAGEHYDYITDGARIGIGTHIDYICRTTGLGDPAGELAMDALDEQDERDEKNRLAYYTNIPGGRERERSLFEASERAVPAPKTYHLLVSTAQAEALELQLKLGDAPPWFRTMARRLRAERDKIERDAAKNGTAPRHRKVVIAEVDQQQAYHQLDWCDHRPGISGLVGWKQGRTERSHFRFVGELPDRLSPRERHEILTLFCDMLSDDGWMVVGAIHQPDAHNDHRNFHLHVDAVDRKAEWLAKEEPVNGDDPLPEETAQEAVAQKEGCWDFEHVVRKNGKDTRPYRQNKVRYDVPTAGLMRSRFIDIVNKVVADRPGVVRYLHGTYADNGIDLTPLEHMGNRVSGLEKRGIVTEVGSINARRIAADEAAACERRASEAEAALAAELVLVRAIVAQNRAALTAADQYERLQRRLIRRRLQAELAEVVIAMARSRADAVIRTLTPAPGQRVRSRAGDADLLADARRHLNWVERHSPTLVERDEERRVLIGIEKCAAMAWTIVEAAVARAGDGGAQAGITYRPRHRSKAKDHAAQPSRYDDLKRDRLMGWLTAHLSDAALVLFDGNEVRLDKSVPPSIDTLMRRFAAEPRFQRRLAGERQRRGAASATNAATSAVVPVPNASPPVFMIPVDRWSLPERVGMGSAPAAAPDFGGTEATPAADGPDLDHAISPVAAAAAAANADAASADVVSPSRPHHADAGQDSTTAHSLSDGIADDGRAHPPATARDFAQPLLNKAIALLKRGHKLVSRAENGSFVVDTEGLPLVEKKMLAVRMSDPHVQAALAELLADQIENLGLTLPDPAATQTASRLHDQSSNGGMVRGTHIQNKDQALPRRRAGLQPPAGLASLRVLRAVGVDDRPPDATGVLPDVRGADVRRGSPVHLEVRGAPADRLTDTAGIAATSTSGHAPGQRNPAPRRGLWEQAEDAAQAGAEQPARPKGPADFSDGTVSGQGRGDHGR